MATVSPTYDSGLSTLTVTNLHSLNDGSAWQSAGIDNEGTEDAVWANVLISIETTTTAGDAAGYLDVYMAESIEGTPDYTGGASGSEGAYSPSPSLAEQKKNLRYLGRIAAKADETTARTYEKLFHIPAWTLPQNWSVIIINETGTDIASSNNAVYVSNNKGDVS